jgi:chemotaxis protein CheX
MNVEYINPFLISLQNVLSMLFGIKPKIGKIYLKNSSFQDYTVNIELKGEINGIFSLVINDDTVKKIASRMIGQTISQIDSLSISAIGELGNMIAGNTCTLYSKKGLHTNISTPKVVKGEDEMLKKATVICIPILLNEDLGNLNVGVAIN